MPVVAATPETLRGYGYLVDDPEGYQAELLSDYGMEDKVDLWLIGGAERGSREGDRAAGPVGAVVGGAVGAGVGAVNGVLGIPPHHYYHHCHGFHDRYGHFHCYR